MSRLIRHCQEVPSAHDASPALNLFAPTLRMEFFQRSETRDNYSWSATDLTS